jgi:hypothetical protein
VAGTQAPDLLDRVLDDHGDALFDFALAVTDRAEAAVEAVQEALPAALETYGASVSRAALLGSVLEAVLRRAPAERVPGLPRGLLEPASGPGGPGVSPNVSVDHLARLSWDATRALEPRHRGILDLILRQGLEGEALSVALGVAPGQATATTQEALEQAEHVVGAVLLSHVAHADCPGLAAVLEALPTDAGTERLAEEVEGHLESCPSCDDRRRTLVPVTTLLAAAPPTPAPPELRRSSPAPRSTPAPDRPSRRRPSGRTLTIVAAITLVAALAGLALARRDGSGRRTQAAAGRLVVAQAGGLDLGPLDRKGTFTLANSGPESLDFTVRSADPWLVTATNQGRIPPGEDVALTVTLDRSRAPEGEATSELRITSSGGSAVLPVRAAVDRAPVLAQIEAVPQPVVPLGCPGATPAQVRVTVVEESGLAQVQLHWRLPDRTERMVEMAEEAQRWSAPLGPFDGPGNVVWWIAATDIRANTTLSPTQILPVVAC